MFNVIFFSSRFQVMTASTTAIVAGIAALPAAPVAIACAAAGMLFCAFMRANKNRN